MDGWMDGWMDGRICRRIHGLLESYMVRQTDIWMDNGRIDGGWVDRWTDWWMDRQIDGWTDRLMDGQTDGWMDRQIDGWTYRWMDRQMDGWTDRWMDGQMDGWMDRQMDGWTDRWTEPGALLTINQFICWSWKQPLAETWNTIQCVVINTGSFQPLLHNWLAKAVVCAILSVGWCI